MRSRVDLNGAWQRYVHNKLIDTIQVPVSLRPVGYYSLKRSFLLPRLTNRQRAVLHFEAITYHARVFLNDNELGTMDPYVPHEFDFTAQAREGENEIHVAIVDGCVGPNGEGKDELAFGIRNGWECYGGIIRDAFVEIRPAVFIDNVRLAYSLGQNYDAVSCNVRVLTSCTSEGSGQLTIELRHRRDVVAEVQRSVKLAVGNNETEAVLKLRDPALWSPEEPNLYTLFAKLSVGDSTDEWQCRTGFRDIAIRGRHFELNGKRLVLNGICRMELWKDQGFTMDRRQRELDMRGIKELGCNFVRPQPFPHDRQVIDLADELGLLLSEEPGYWWADFRSCERSFIDLGLRIMEKVIRRDWNSPAVMFWLLGNESYFTESYLKEAKALCNKLDPIARPVSIAHENAEVPEAKKLFDDAGLDFYDWHAYEFSDDKFKKLPVAFGPDKPLTFTEWGWEDLGQEVIFYERYFDRLLEQTEAGNVAGHMFFDWNDYPEFTRRDWSVEDGILRSGAVTESREIRQPLYSRLAALFDGRHEVEQSSPPIRPAVLPLKRIPFSPSASFRSIDLQILVDSAKGKKSWLELSATFEKFWPTTSMAQNQWDRTGRVFALWRQPETRIAGVLFRSPVVEQSVRPVLLTKETPELDIAIDQACSHLHLLGQVMFPLGYPVTGSFGEVAAIYTLRYASGKVKEYPVRHGIEVAQANLICEATRIDPVAISAQRVLEFTKDPARERYQALLWSIAVAQEKLVSLHCQLKGAQQPIAIFAVTAEV